MELLLFNLKNNIRRVGKIEQAFDIIYCADDDKGAEFGFKKKLQQAGFCF